MGMNVTAQNASVQWQPDGLKNPHQEVVPRSRIPRRASHLSFKLSLFVIIVIMIIISITMYYYYC